MLAANAVAAPVALALAVTSAAPAGAAESCFADWSVAAPIVKTEGLATVEQLSQLARSSGSGEIVKTTLCRSDAGYVYRVVLKDGKGQLKTLSVDARKPFAR